MKKIVPKRTKVKVVPKRTKVKSAAHKVVIPSITNITTECGEVFLVGGLTDAGIKYIGAEITELMLETAKKQRIEMRKKGHCEA